MALSYLQPGTLHVLSIFLIVICLATDPCLAGRPRRNPKLNIIDKCWRKSPSWWTNRQQLATCSVGFAGKMTDNVGEGLTPYIVTDPSDDNPMDPNAGTLRYATTRLLGKVWITFQRDMHITLQRKLVLGSFTTIDGRGANVHITGGAGFLLRRVNNVIIHGLHFHHLRPQAAGQVLGPGSKVLRLTQADGDAVRLIGSSKVWIDHNTFYSSHDGLLDVTVGSTDVTISNNWFKDHDKVMLLGHEDGFVQDKNMKVSIIFNRFGPNCNQRMPRIRHGYAHVANNFYDGWGDYAIGGSMNPTIRSEANVFSAPKAGKKEVTWAQNKVAAVNANWRSVRDMFINGATFKQRGRGAARPRYNLQQQFKVSKSRHVRSLTTSAGALQCSTKSRC